MEKYKIPVHPTNNEAIFTISGKRLDRETEHKLYTKEWELYYLIKEIAESTNKEKYGFDMEGVVSVKDFLFKNREKIFERFDIKPEEQVEFSNLFLHLEGNDGATYEMLSFDGMSAGKELDGDHVIFPGGYSTLLNHVAGNVVDLVKLEHVVEAVIKTVDANGQSKVVVQTNKGDFDCDCVVVTVPLGVLKARKIKFFPALPKWKEDVIDRIGFGLYNKIFLEFEESFWPEDIDVFRIITEIDAFAVNNYTASDLSIDDNFTQTCVNLKGLSGRNVLMCTTVSERSKFFESLPNETIVEIMRKKFAKVFGREIPKVVNHYVTRWNSDPFSLGGYAHVALDGSPDDFDVLAKPIDTTVYFAGDTTYKDYNTCVHGAYLSGLAASKKISADWPINLNLR